MFEQRRIKSSLNGGSQASRADAPPRSEFDHAANMRALPKPTQANRTVHARPFEATQEKADGDGRSMTQNSPAAAWDFGALPIFPPGKPQSDALQPKLGSSFDVAEQEADSMAAAALNMPQIGVCATAPDPVHGRIGRTAREEIVEVNRSPGTALPSDIRSAFDHRYGFDFSQVRIHEGEQAARAAQAVGAQAFSLGPDLVFAKGAYDPRSQRGTTLLAHELAHVVQHARAGDRQPVLRRSLLGTSIGAGIGAAVGGVTFGLLGSLLGPAGAVLGGVLGALGGGILGGWIGDKVSSRSRKLTQPEKDAAKAIFRTSVDLDVVEIRRGSFLSGGATPRTSGNVINMSDDQFVGNTLTLAPDGALTLIHELVHVWQYQHGGFSYVESSLVPQAVATSRGISRNAAYNWRDSVNNRIPWEQWNAEEQAQCISDYNEAQLRIEADNYSGGDRLLKDIDTATLAEPHLDKLRAGIGAPGSKLPPQPSP
jgi:hypothetical protein